jgi:hypothetical protein
MSAAPGAASAQPRSAVEAAANALGGLERVRALKTIRMQGYGQYAYMFGGGNIVGDRHAPQKFEAANALERVYDLTTGRFQQLERRNFLFPFAIASGHDYHLNDERLDGDIAYDVMPSGEPERIYRWKENAHRIDGVHMRRMWSITNPVAAVRAALDPRNRIAAGRAEAGLDVIDVTLKEGDRFGLAIDRRSHLPRWVRWANPQQNFGQVTLTTYYSGYTPHDGILLPLGYQTESDWREVPYLKIYVDAYVIDGPVPDLAAPRAVRDAPDPQLDASLTSVPVAKGIWRLSSGTTVFEFADHLVLFELASSQALAQASIDLARKLVPGKPIRWFIASHNHVDHVSGIRVAVAEGIGVISRRNNEQVFREQITHPSPDFPDALQRHPRAMKFMPVDEHVRLADSAMTLDIYWSRNNTHMADAVFAYAPASRVMAEADMATAAYDYQFWPDNYEDVKEYYNLDVRLVSPVHAVVPGRPDVLTNAEVIDLIKGGVKRTREHCAREQAKGNWFTGCPVQSKRY